MDMCGLPVPWRGESAGTFPPPTGCLDASGEVTPCGLRRGGLPNHGEHQEVAYRDNSANYFFTLEARLLHGRYFTEDEDKSRPSVVVINREKRSNIFPGEDPIGKQISSVCLGHEPTSRSLVS
jgi:hypothetical protein